MRIDQFVGALALILAAAFAGHQTITRASPFHSCLKLAEARADVTTQRVDLYAFCARLNLPW